MSSSADIAGGVRPSDSDRCDGYQREALGTPPFAWTSVVWYFYHDNGRQRRARIRIAGIRHRMDPAGGAVRQTVLSPEISGEDDFSALHEVRH